MTELGQKISPGLNFWDNMGLCIFFNQLSGEGGGGDTLGLIPMLCRWIPRLEEGSGKMQAACAYLSECARFTVILSFHLAWHFHQISEDGRDPKTAP